MNQAVERANNAVEPMNFSGLDHTPTSRIVRSSTAISANVGTINSSMPSA